MGRGTDRGTEVPANDDTPDRRTLGAWQRALWQLPRDQRAAVARCARLLLAALEAPAPARAPRLAPLTDEELAEPVDEIARAEARRILARHRRGDGAA